MAGLERLALRDLFERAASTDPSPGGGAVTALCGMLGIALMLKALRISLRRSEEAGRWAGEDEALTALADRLAADADGDDAAFAAYVAAARLPRESEGERAARGAALEAAAIRATEAALASLAHARDAFAAGRRIEPAVKPSIRADLVAGRELLKVVRAAAIDNAEANLAALRDSALREPLAERLAALAEPGGFA